MCCERLFLKCKNQKNVISLVFNDQAAPNLKLESYHCCTVIVVLCVPH